MCHLILLTPVFALAVFWIWPLAVAGPVYTVVTVLSLWMYALVWRAMQRPVLGGSEELLHSIGEVMEVRIMPCESVCIARYGMRNPTLPCSVVSGSR